jgi:hypothetical protein
MQIIKQGTFKTKDDITRLGFLDFSRPVKNAADDLQGILHWLPGFQPEGEEGACRMRSLPSGNRGCRE